MGEYRLGFASRSGEVVAVLSDDGGQGASFSIWSQDDLSDKIEGGNLSVEESSLYAETLGALHDVSGDPSLYADLEALMPRGYDIGDVKMVDIGVPEYELAGVTLVDIPVPDYGIGDVKLVDFGPGGVKTLPGSQLVKIPSPGMAALEDSKLVDIPSQGIGTLKGAQLVDIPSQDTMGTIPSAIVQFSPS